MPIFEYICEDCGKDSELLVRSDTVVACEHCGGKKLKKKLSVFSINSHSASEVPACSPACGGGFQQGMCGSGMCGSH
jgi:putative FmdB family regulatory protein